MKYTCPKCSTEFIQDTKFCNKCGYNLEMEFIETPTCPKCEKTFPTGTKFCDEHGIELTSANDVIETDVEKSMAKKYGVLIGTIGIIFCSLFNWVKIPPVSLLGIRITDYAEHNLFSLISVHGIFIVFVVVMVLALAMLITSLFMKSQKAKSARAYVGFEMYGGITGGLIIGILINGWTPTIFPFITLAIAILAMVFVIKRPTKKERLNAVKEFLTKLP